jgi:ESX secretion-associated protein EspG
VLKTPVSVSKDAWEAVRQRHGFEEQHHMLAVPIPDVTLAEYPAWERRCFDELARIGMATGMSVHPDLVATMGVLARPPLELFGQVGYHNRVAVGVVAASDGRSAVLAVLDDRALHLRPIAPDKLAEAAVGLLPPAPSGRGQSISISLAAANRLSGGTAASSSDDEPQSWLQSSSNQVAPEARTLRRLLAEPRLGGGRLYAGVRDGLGRHRRSPQPLTYMDFESGRWMFQQKPGSGGEMWLIVRPATPESLTGAANDLLAEITARM